MTVPDTEIYLSDLSPKDKPWDKHGKSRDRVREMYAQSPDPRHQRYAQRMGDCSQFLKYLLDNGEDGTQIFNLNYARFCRVRFCPACQWRKSLKWSCKFRRGLPKLLEVYPNHQFIFLTLTVRNCPMDELSATVRHMDSSFRKLVKRKLWPSLGWAKALEVTLGKDGNPHPHFHVLMMVKPSYFSGTTYINQATWTQLWKECAKLDYTPTVDVRKVKPKKGKEDQGIIAAVAETLKYSIKESDLVANPDFLIGVTDQLHGVRAVNLGGCFLKHIKDERETDDLIHVDEDNIDLDEKDLPSVSFGWRETSKRYVLNS